MKSFKELVEARQSTIVMSFGRMNPPTSGHALLVNAVVSLAKKHNADHVIYLSKTQDPKKNPLTVDQKVYYARQAFKGVNIVGANDKIRTFIEVAKLLTGKYKNLIMVAGSDRVLEYKQLLDKYNGKEFNFDSILVVSAGERDPDADGASGMSASKMRAAAAANDFVKFKQGVPVTMQANVAKKMFDDVRVGMKLTESVDDVREDYVNDRIFNIGDIVEHAGSEQAIVFRGPNYVVLEDQSKVWLDNIKPTNKVNEAIMVKQQDKIKAARIIGMALGYEDAESKNDPSQIINAALRSIRNKPLNTEAKSILARMLELAKKMEIRYDEKLVNESRATADYRISPSGRKVHTKVIVDKGAAVEPEEKEAHNLMHKPGGAQQSEYERLRKIHIKAHESVEEPDEDLDDDDLEELLQSITDDDVIEHGYDDEEFEVIDEETGELVEAFESDMHEVLSRIERMRAKVRMKRSEAKRERMHAVALKKRSSGDVLARRARRVAIKAIEKKIAKKPLNQLSVGEKERIEARVARMKPAITRLAAKMLPRVRQVEKSRLERRNTQG
jgi:hypothetical protein